MARENQGLQIALIIFVMLFIITSVTTFIYVKQFNEQFAKAAAAAEEAAKQKGAADNAVRDNTQLKEMVGVATTAGMDEITGRYNQLMEEVAGGTPEAERDLIKVCTALFDTVQARNESLASEQAKSRSLETTIEGLEKSKVPLVTAQEQRATAAETLLSQERTKYTDGLNTARQQAQVAADTLASAQAASDKAIADLRAAIAGKDTQLQGLIEVNERNVTTIEKIYKPTFEVADGKIRWVNQRAQTVWVSLGRGDSLQQRTSFSVYPADTNDVSKVGKKADIEITQILGDHLAEARIVEDTPSDPIMPGDVIHTPVWAPGEAQHFALMDGLDLTGNDKSDLDRVINLIKMNGGEVDVWIDDEGNRYGQFTAATRIMVEGDAPDETSTQERRTARTQMINEATARGIRRVPLPELLRMMGWKNQSPVVRFGRGANPDDFRPKPPEGVPKVSAGTVSDLFKSRKPPKPSGSAY